MSAIINLIKEKKDKKNKSTPVYPRNVGWVVKKLSEDNLDLLWSCVDAKPNSPRTFRKSNKKRGNSSYKIKQYDLEDCQNKIWNSIVEPLVKDYQHHYKKDKSDGDLHLRQFWVNYQKQTDYVPLHSHKGVYSFVIWLKIPTNYEDQKKLPIARVSNSSAISNFVFTYTDILGEVRSMSYEMSSKVEGTMVLFPSGLNHQVYPFYNCDKSRISISGNVDY